MMKSALTSFRNRGITVSPDAWGRLEGYLKEFAQGERTSVIKSIIEKIDISKRSSRTYHSHLQLLMASWTLLIWTK